MDKDLLRIVIIVVGGVVILGMIVWGMLSKDSKRKQNIFHGKSNSLSNIDPNLVVNTEDDDFDIIPLSTRDNEDYFKIKTQLNSSKVDEIAELHNDDDQELELDLDLYSELQLDMAEPLEEIHSLEDTQKTAKEKQQLPALLQLSIVAQAKEGFTGILLRDACEQVGLVFGSVRVFERLDFMSRVDYAVASMLEPGIFPSDQWESYYCPGITFFMQPREVEHPAAVFAEMMNTIEQLSGLLKGDILDQSQQPLLQEALHGIEESLI